jgi:1-deoxy-D-xylulose-5-phosphate reductoisomerase
MKTITILGSTGSIGKNTVRVIQQLKDRFYVHGIAAHSSIELLAQQAEELNCKNVVCGKPYTEQLSQLAPKGTKILADTEGMVEISTASEVDIVLCAVVGTSALLPVLEAIRAGKDIAIASKEILVMAGELVMAEATKYGVKILPVDSEHSAIFQCLENKRNSDISRIILTASGGAFRNSSTDEIENATYKEASVHPTWNMGPKVTLDSASLMNKALEMVEAKWLFNVTPDKIDVIIHPQSIIHSMVEFIDGTVLAQMNVADMRFPIQYALTYPEKISGGLKPLNFTKIGNLSFEKPDRKRFPSLDFAYIALKAGGTLPTVMNAANETAAERFQKGEISFIQIWKIIEKVMSLHKVIMKPTLDEIIAVDNWAKKQAGKI